MNKIINLTKIHGNNASRLALEALRSGDVTEGTIFLFPHQNRLVYSGQSEQELNKEVAAIQSYFCTKDFTNDNSLSTKIFIIRNKIGEEEFRKWRDTPNDLCPQGLTPGEVIMRMPAAQSVIDKLLSECENS